MCRHKQQWISHKMNYRHPRQLKKSKSWEPFWSYQLNSFVNPAHLPQNWAKSAKLAGLFIWQLQNGSQDLDFFNCHGCQYFILCKSIATYAPTFFGYIISVLAILLQQQLLNVKAQDIYFGFVIPFLDRKIKFCLSINFTVLQLYDKMKQVDIWGLSV